jgi:hypothetical protein
MTILSLEAIGKRHPHHDPRVVARDESGPRYFSLATNTEPSSWRVFVVSKGYATPSETVAEISIRRPVLLEAI